jgi:ribosomal protein S18 acetylase RimI-like enzyme
MLDNIDFSPVTIEDFQFGYDLWKLTQKEYLDKIRGQWNEEFENANYKDERNRNIENNYLIKYNKNNIGWFEYELYTKYIYINQIHIQPEYQGKGIGTKIISEIIKYGKRNKKNIYLDVLMYNDKALEFYKKIGFKMYRDSSLENTLEYDVLINEPSGVSHHLEGKQ